MQNNQNGFSNTFLESMISKSEILVFPSIGHSIVRLLNKPIDQKELSSLIKQDVGLSTSLLRYVNSASMPVSQNISDIERAVNILGVDRAFSVAFTDVVSTQIRSTAASVRFTVFLEVWGRSILTALFCEFYAGDKTNAYIVGLVHYIGIIVLMESYSNSYLGYLRISEGDINALKTLELKHFDTSYESVSHWIVGRWGLPSAIVEELSPKCSSQRLSHAVGLANSLILYSYGKVKIENMSDHLHGFFSSDFVMKQSSMDDNFSSWFCELKDRYFNDLPS